MNRFLSRMGRHFRPSVQQRFANFNDFNCLVLLILIALRSIRIAIKLRKSKNGNISKNNKLKKKSSKNENLEKNTRGLVFYLQTTLS